MKICSKCKQEKNEIEFNKNAVRKDGLQSFCRVCDNERKRKYYAQNPTRFFKYNDKRTQRLREEVQKYKTEKGCAHCGERDFRCLDFHHSDANLKVAEVSFLMRYRGEAAVWEEITKCEVVCANCHRKHHYDQIILERQS